MFTILSSARLSSSEVLSSSRDKLCAVASSAAARISRRKALTDATYLSQKGSHGMEKTMTENGGHLSTENGGHLSRSFVANRFEDAAVEAWMTRAESTETSHLAKVDQR